MTSILKPQAESTFDPSTLVPNLSAIEQAATLGIGAINRGQDTNALSNAAARQPIPIDSGNPFSIVSLDLSGTNPGSAGIQAAGVPVEIPGYALFLRKEGTAPGARLVISIGGESVTLFPGDRITGYFNRFNVRIDTNNPFIPAAVSGVAYLVVERRPDARLIENVARAPGGSSVIASGTVPVAAAGTLFIIPAASPVDVQDYAGVMLRIYASVLTGTGTPAVQAFLRSEVSTPTGYQKFADYGASNLTAVDTAGTSVCINGTPETNSNYIAHHGKVTHAAAFLINGGTTITATVYWELLGIT